MKTFAHMCSSCDRVSHETDRKFCRGCGNPTLFKITVIIGSDGSIKYRMYVLARSNGLVLPQRVVLFCFVDVLSRIFIFSPPAPSDCSLAWAQTSAAAVSSDTAVAADLLICILFCFLPCRAHCVCARARVCVCVCVCVFLCVCARARAGLATGGPPHGATYSPFQSHSRDAQTTWCSVKTKKNSTGQTERKSRCRKRSTRV